MVDVMTSERDIENMMLRLVREHVHERSIAPSDVARAVAPKGTSWQGLLRRVRDVAVRLASEEQVVILRKGQPVDPKTFRGVYRIAAGAQDELQRIRQSVSAVLPEVGFGTTQQAFDDYDDGLTDYQGQDPALFEDPDGLRPVQPGTMTDIAGVLEYYLRSKLDHAAGGYAEIGDDVVGLPGEVDEETVLPDRHSALRRDLERTPTDEE